VHVVEPDRAHGPVVGFEPSVPSTSTMSDARISAMRSSRAMDRAARLACFAMSLRGLYSLLV
jgi:hypothetical protein